MNKIILFVIIISLFNSCNPCRNLDCRQSNYTLKFRLLDQNSESDLFFGSQSIYNPNETKMYALYGTDTTYFEFQFATYGSDSILSVDFYPEAPIIYMEFQNGDIDTFFVNYKTESSECCGIITTMNIRYGTQEIVGDNQVKIFMK